LIYAVRAVGPVGARKLSTLAADEVHPIFRGTLEPDVTFLGFNLTPAEVTATPGWFFVLQQQPTEPRFGMDDDPFGPGENRQDPRAQDLERFELGAHRVERGGAEGDQPRAGHQESRIEANDPSQPAGNVGPQRGAHGYITKQLPTRVAIHASQMIHRRHVAEDFLRRLRTNRHVRIRPTIRGRAHPMIFINPNPSIPTVPFRATCRPLSSAPISDRAVSGAARDALFRDADGGFELRVRVYPTRCMWTRTSRS